MSKIFIIGTDIDVKEIELMIKENTNSNIEVANLTSMELMDINEVVYVIFEFMQTIPYSIAYDMMKMVLVKIMNQIIKMKPPKNVHYIKVIHEEKISIIETNIELSDKEKVIDAAIKVLMSDISES